MTYVRTRNNGLGRMRNGNGGVILSQITRPEGVSLPLMPTEAPGSITPIYGGGSIAPTYTKEEMEAQIARNAARFGYSVPDWLALSDEEIRTAVNRAGIESTLQPLIHPAVPDRQAFEVDDTRFISDLLPPTIPAETRMTEVSYPIDTANAKLAFELAEAHKYGYPRDAWMAMGVSGRSAVRTRYPGGYNPTTRDGVSISAATVDIISGRDPIRSRENYSGAGDYEGGMEIREPRPSVPLKTTKSGITFDDLIKIDPTKVQTAEEAAGVVTAGAIPSQDYVRFGIMAVAGWILWDIFLKPKKRRAPRKRITSRRPRRFTPRFNPNRMRQGWQ